MNHTNLPPVQLASSPLPLPAADVWFGCSEICSVFAPATGPGERGNGVRDSGKRKGRWW